MDPAELPARMPAADRDLAARDMLAAAHLDPGADRVDVRRRLLQFEPDPVAETCTFVAPDLRPAVAVDVVDTDLSVEIDIGESGSAAGLDARHAGRLASFLERPVGLLQQQVVRVLLGEVRHVRHIALGHE